MNQSKLKNFNDIMSMINFLCELFESTYITEPLRKPSIDKENIGNKLNTLIASMAKDDQNVKPKVTPNKVGPFFKQERKLQKFIYLMEKKEKSKKAKETAATIAYNVEKMELINSNVNYEPEINDVVMVPLPPLTEEEIVKENDSNYLPLTIFDLDYSNNLIKPPKLLKQNFGNENIYSNEAMRMKDSSVKWQQENEETSNQMEFETIETLKSYDYTVEEDNFTDLDIYESESDISDRPYSKQARMSDVIDVSDTSSDDSYSQTAEWLFKRRTINNDTQSIFCNTKVTSNPEDNNALLCYELAMERCMHKRKQSIQTTDSSDTDGENEDDAQIIMLPKGKAKKTRTEYGSPIYNDIPDNRGQTPTHLGWNVKICKFYNNSYKENHFDLHKFFQRLNLWD